MLWTAQSICFLFTWKLPINGFKVESKVELKVESKAESKVEYNSPLH